MYKLMIKNRFDRVILWRSTLRQLRAITLENIEFWAEKVADITRPDQTLLTTRAVRQPQSDSCYKLRRHRRTDSRYPEDCFQTTRLHLRPHPLQKLFQRVGQWRLVALGFAFEASADPRAFTIDPRGLVVNRFRFPHDLLFARQVKLGCIIGCLSHLGVAFRKALASIAIMLGVIDDRRVLEPRRRLNKCSIVRHGRSELNKPRVTGELH